MKYKLMTVLAVIVTVIVFLYFYNSSCHRKLPEIKEYRIMSNTGIIIPAKIYLRTKQNVINANNRNMQEIILCFDDSVILNELNISGDERLNKFLVIVPELKIIGLANHTNSFRIRDKFICQRDYKADDFTSMINNFTFYKNPPIHKAIFKDSQIQFNTFGILKKFGDSINITITKL